MGSLLVQFLRLADLAHHMAQTGGPVDFMDGTVESLTPLWGWFLERMHLGFPEIPAGSAPSRTRFLRWELDDLTGRTGYAIEPVGHYLLEILRLYRPEARWGLYVPTSPDDNQLHATVAHADPGYQMPLERIPYGVALKTLQDRKGRAPESYLEEKVRSRMLLDSLGNPRDTAGLSLERLLNTPPAPLSDPRRIPPIAEEAVLINPHPDRSSSSPPALYVADVAVDLSELFSSATPAVDPFSTFRPLDENIIAAGLARLGAHINGVAVTPTSLLEDADIIVRDNLVIMGSIVVDGRLRALRLEPLWVSDKEWSDFERDLQEVAAAAGAKYGPFYDFVGRR